MAEETLEFSAPRRGPVAPLTDECNFSLRKFRRRLGWFVAEKVKRMFLFIIIIIIIIIILILLFGHGEEAEGTYSGFVQFCA